MQVAHILALH